MKARLAAPLGLLYEAVRPRLDLIEREIAAQIAAGPPAVRETAAYVLQAGGKRLRPAILAAVARMLGHTGDRDVRYGVVVEMIHTASLVHDDIIDRARVRRGRASANHRWGNQLTVLLGDWLYIRAMELALEEADIPAMRVLAHATTQMTEGELLSLDTKGSDAATEEQHLEVCRRKTAELFAAASALPSYFDPSFARYRPALEDYGRNLGMCFQIIDDILDVTASTRRLGKPAFTDLREGRITLPFIYLLPRIAEGERALIEEVIATGALPGSAKSSIRQLLARHGTVEIARSVAATYAQRAAGAMMLLPPSQDRDAMAAAPRLLVERRS
jgi:octaprenyl-diphosphate synthase